jgi:hypothetical protein
MKKNAQNVSSDDQVIDLLQKLIMIELAKQQISQDDIAKVLGIGKLKVNTVLKHINLKKKV